MKQNTLGNNIQDFSMAINIVGYFAWNIHRWWTRLLCTCLVYVCVCVCVWERETETERQTDRQRQREWLSAQQRFFFSFFFLLLFFSYFHSSSGLDLINFQCKCQHLAFQMSRHKYVLIITEHTHWNGPQNEAYECVWEMISQLMMK